jgi:hypothetical protein
MRRILSLAAALALVACADVNSVVGGACADGYVQQGDTCVLGPSGTPPNPTPALDGGPGYEPDAGGDGPAQGTDAAPDAPGSSTTTSKGPGSGVLSYCVAPEIACGDECIDPSTDPNNCGACGKVCPSNACSGGKCVGSAPGHVVVIGHDYATAPTTFSSQARVLANAVLLPASNPLRIMSYEQYASAGAVQNAESLVAAEAKQLGRGVTFVSEISSADVSSQIDETSYDVLLVHDQANAPAGTLGVIGTSWASDGRVAAFLHEGGVVVVLTGGGGTGEMADLTTNAGLLDVTSEISVSGSLTVLAPADAVGTGVVSPYVPKPSTVALDTEANGGNVVWVVAKNGAPVVVHKVVP